MCSPKRSRVSCAISFDSPKRLGFESPCGSPMSSPRTYETPVAINFSMEMATPIAQTPLFAPSPFTPPPFTNYVEGREIGDGKGKTSIVKMAKTGSNEFVIKRTFAQTPEQKTLCRQNGIKPNSLKTMVSPQGDKEIRPMETVELEVKCLEENCSFAVPYYGATVSDREYWTEVEIYMALAQKARKTPENAKKFLQMALGVNEVKDFSCEMTEVLNDPKADNLGEVNGELRFLDFAKKPVQKADISSDRKLYELELVAEEDVKIFRYLAALWLTYQELYSETFNLSAAKDIVKGYTLTQLQNELNSLL